MSLLGPPPLSLGPLRRLAPPRLLRESLREPRAHPDGLLPDRGHRDLARKDPQEPGPCLRRGRLAIVRPVPASWVM